jgi:predicted nucleic acid-binding protein
MIAYLRDEDGAEVVEGHLVGDEKCMTHAVNLCEVYYDFIRAEDEDTAKSAIEDLKGDGLVVRDDIEESFWQEVGRYKAANRVSLADCFAIALANRNDARVVTSDHHEFDPIKEQGICEVEFIR